MFSGCVLVTTVGLDKVFVLLARLVLTEVSEQQQNRSEKRQIMGGFCYRGFGRKALGD